MGWSSTAGLYSAVKKVGRTFEYFCWKKGLVCKSRKVRNVAAAMPWFVSSNMNNTTLVQLCFFFLKHGRLCEEVERRTRKKEKSQADDGASEQYE